MEYKSEIVIKNEKLIVRTYTMPVGSVIKPTEPVLDVYMRNNLSVDFNIQLPTGTVIKQEIRSITRPLTPVTPDNYEFFNEQKVKEYLNENNFTKEDVYHIALAGYTYPIIYSRIIPISTLSTLEVKNLHDTLVNELNTLISNLTGSVSTEESTNTTPISNESKITTSSVIIISVLICVFILLIILSFYMKGK